MKNFIKILDKLTSIIQGLSAVFLFIMLVITFIQVVLRYVFNNPTMWSEEITLVMLIWFGYMVISLAVEEEGHIALKSFYLKCNDGVRKICDVIRHLLMIGFSTLMIFYGIKLVNLSKTQYLPASHLNRSILYAALIFSGVMIILYSIVNLLKRIIDYDEREVRN